MNARFFVAWVVVFVVWMVGSFFVHGMLLRQDYSMLPNLFRSDTESQPLFHWMIIAHVIMAGAFVWIYSRGSEARPWLGQGLRFGAAVALMTAVPTYMIYYVVQPMPGASTVKQISFDGALLLVLGAVVAFVYRGRERA